MLVNSRMVARATRNTFSAEGASDYRLTPKSCPTRAGRLKAAARRARG
jgi:hypothetical protein